MGWVGNVIDTKIIRWNNVVITKIISSLIIYFNPGLISFFRNNADGKGGSDQYDGYRQMEGTGKRELYFFPFIMVVARRNCRNTGVKSIKKLHC
jgi:hypothetical protein